MARRDLSLDEQKRVLAYLTMLRAKFGNWTTLEQALPFSHSARVEITAGRREVGASLAFRIAKLMGVSIADVLAGTAFPPGTYRHCGRSNDE